MIKKLDCLDGKEFDIIYDKNSKIRDEVYQSVLYLVLWCSHEYLDCFDKNLFEYNFDCGSKNYFHCKEEGNFEDFINSLKCLQENYCFLTDTDFEKVLHTEVLIEEQKDYLQDLEFHPDNFPNPKEVIEAKKRKVEIYKKIDNLEEAVTSRINDEFSILYDEQFLKAYFQENWENFLNNDTCYVDKNYIVYENIVKCYA